MAIDPSDYEHFAQINASKKIGCFYALDQAGANVDLFGYGPDLEIADPSMWTDNPEWLTGNGTTDFAGFHSDGTPTEEEQAQNLFQLNNGMILVAFQISYAAAPSSKENTVSMGGINASGVKALDFAIETDGRMQMNTSIDNTGTQRNMPAYDATSFTSNEMTAVFVNDARSGETENGMGIGNGYAAPNGAGLTDISSKVFANYYGQSNFGNILGYPAGMTSGTGLFLGAKWNNDTSQWVDNVPFQIRRLIILNLKKIDPRNRGDIAFELLYNDCLPGAATYRGILNA